VGAESVLIRVLFLLFHKKTVVSVGSTEQILHGFYKTNQMSLCMLIFIYADGFFFVTSCFMIEWKFGFSVRNRDSIEAGGALNFFMCSRSKSGGLGFLGGRRVRS
jgi:hypothetical protein